MPVIIIGADTPLGPAVVDALSSRDGEIRAFVSTVEILDDLRGRGIKTAYGDVSDGSHIGGAALNAFVGVLIADAATDERERAFAPTPGAVHAQWADGLNDAGVTRAIWVGPEPIPDVIARAVPQSASVPTEGRPPEEVAAEVAALDEAREVASSELEK